MNDVAYALSYYAVGGAGGKRRATWRALHWMPFLDTRTCCLDWSLADPLTPDVTCIVSLLFRWPQQSLGIDPVVSE